MCVSVTITVWTFQLTIEAAVLNIPLQTGFYVCNL